MTVIMDGLLVAGTLFAGIYCFILSRRVRALMDLDKGLGGAITTMSRQIEQARLALDEAKTTARGNREELQQLLARADAAAGQLRVLIAAQRDAEPLRRAPRAERNESPEALAPAPAPVPTPKPAPAPAAQRPRLAVEPEPDLPPKPSGGAALDAILRRPLAPRAQNLRSEDEILAALSALAGGKG